jgi:ATP-dependent Clp protease ATP-binding subunit ClpC
MDRGFDPTLGARPLRRAIQRFVEDPLSEILLRRGLKKDAGIQVGVKGEGLDFQVVTETSDTK